jgi:hypothetical protein
MRTGLILGLFLALLPSMGQSAALRLPSDNAARTGIVAANGLSAVGKTYGELQTKGAVILPPGRFMSPRTEAAFNRAWRSDSVLRPGKDNLHVLYMRDAAGSPGEWSTNSRRIRTFLYGLTSRLRTSMPNESFYLDYAVVQVTDGKKPRAREIHTDRRLPYQVVISYPLLQRSRGVVVYRTNDNVTAYSSAQAGPRSAAVMSGIGREIAGQMEAVLHAAPGQSVKRRVVLLLSWLTGEVPVDWENYPRRILSAVMRREKKLAALVRRDRRR